MSAQVSIVQGVVKNALVIPSSALREQGPDGRFLVRVVGAKAREPEDRRVRIGVNNHSFAQILDGLKEGEEVVLGDLPAANGPAS
jgi:macrolide-specific efflux system membrane fusion protein